MSIFIKKRTLIYKIKKASDKTKTKQKISFTTIVLQEGSVTIRQKRTINCKVKKFYLYFKNQVMKTIN